MHARMMHIAVHENRRSNAYTFEGPKFFQRPSIDQTIMPDLMPKFVPHKIDMFIV
jgi:hypothetical protein